MNRKQLSVKVPAWIERNLQCTQVQSIDVLIVLKDGRQYNYNEARRPIEGLCAPISGPVAEAALWQIADKAWRDWHRERIVEVWYYDDHMQVLSNGEYMKVDRVN